MLKDSADVVATVCELAQEASTATLPVRIDVHARLSVEALKKIWKATLVGTRRRSYAPEGFELRYPAVAKRSLLIC